MKSLRNVSWRCSLPYVFIIFIQMPLVIKACQTTWTLQNHIKSLFLWLCDYSCLESPLFQDNLENLLISFTFCSKSLGFWSYINTSANSDHFASRFLGGSPLILFQFFVNWEKTLRSITLTFFLTFIGNISGSSYHIFFCYMWG